VVCQGLLVAYSSALDISSFPIFLLSDFSHGKNDACSNYLCFHSLCDDAW